MNDFWAAMDRLFADSRLFGGLYAKVKPLCIKYRELIVYIFVGGPRQLHQHHRAPLHRIDGCRHG